MLVYHGLHLAYFSLYFLLNKCSFDETPFKLL